MQFTNIRERGLPPRQDLEKPRLRVPEFLLYQLLERGGLLAIGPREVRLAGPLGDSGDRQGVAVLVAVDRRATSAAADGHLHAPLILPPGAGSWQPPPVVPAKSKESCGPAVSLLSAAGRDPFLLTRPQDLMGGTARSMDVAGKQAG
jgi:hypothetical protein